MAVDVIAEPTAAQQSAELYNGPSLVRHKTFSPNPGETWGLIGLIVSDAATTADVPALITALEALTQISAIQGDQIWGQTLDIDPSLQWNLYTEAELQSALAYGGDSEVRIKHKKITLPDSKKWIVLAATFSGAPTSAGQVTTFQTAVEGITGVTTCRYLMGVQVPAEAVSPRLRVSVRTRQDLV